MARKPTPLRWSLTMAEREFAVDMKTVAKRLQVAGTAPGDDGLYSTAQLAAALYGGGKKASAQARLAESLARKAEREEAVEARELVPVADVLEVAQRFCSAIRQKIVDAEISTTERAKILREIKAMEDADLTVDPKRDDE